MPSSSTNVPACIGIIMDGNRRFARERGLPTMEGHRLGYAKAKEIVGWCKDAGIKYAILYAFSTENWNRSPKEVFYLTGIFKTLLSETKELQKDGGAVRFIGTIDRFGADFVKQVRRLEANNPTQPTMTFVVALSYGGRLEILNAVNEIVAKGDKDPITEKEFEKHLWTDGIPDPDLIIRTGGEMRLSNFLPWQSIYSELFFTGTYWPAFTREEFNGILKTYGERERRMGK
jgi:undecaprenyl diphosphate synthase